jgi:hypothetical protein
MQKKPAQADGGARILGQHDAQEFSKATKIETRKITRTPASAKAYLVGAGFISAKTGKLTGRYAGRGKGWSRRRGCIASPAVWFLASTAAIGRLPSGRSVGERPMSSAL